MGLFKKHRPLESGEIVRINKYFSENMIHSITGDEFYLKLWNHDFKKLANKHNISSPEELKLLKKSFATAKREGWDPYSTYTALRFGKIPETRLREMYDKAKNTYDRGIKRELLGEVMLEQCTPEERKEVLNAAEKYSVPVHRLAEFNMRFKNVAPEVKEKVFKMAEDSGYSPTYVLEELMKKINKLNK